MSNDLKELTKYPEFYALKQELEKFCDSMDNISDLEGEIKLEEICGRRFASKKVRNLLSDLGLIERNKPIISKTYE